MAVIVNLNLRTEEFERQLTEAIRRGLMKVGMQARKYAREKVPVDTHNLQKSINYELGEDSVSIGTNCEYAAYIEFGTGIYSELGKTEGYWVWVDDGAGGGGGGGKRHTLEEAKKIVAILRKKGLPAFYSNGAKAQHYLRPAAFDHNASYTKLMQTELNRIK